MAIAPPPPVERPVQPEAVPPASDEILAPADHPDADAAAPVGDPLREAMIRSAAGWLVLIAVLTLVNVGATISGTNLSFALGLFSAQLLTAIGSSMGADAGAPAIGYVAAALAAAFALGFGALSFPARAGKSWVFVVALVVYGIDALVLLWLSSTFGDTDVLGLGIHAWALWAIGRGWNASRSPG